MSDGLHSAEIGGPGDLLFAAPVQSRETDERYTPRWVFDALGETFDLDPASPPLGVSQVPTAAVWTKDDDGLTQPWHGFVWCNPPFSIATPWADRFMEHGCGLWLGPIANAAWHDRMTRASTSMVLLRDFAFIGINHAQKRSSMPLSLHAFGARAALALHRFAEHQPQAGVLLERPDLHDGPCCYGWVTSNGSDHEPDCPTYPPGLASGGDAT